jgi:hypothetical protein
MSMFIVPWKSGYGRMVPAFLPETTGINRIKSSSSYLVIAIFSVLKAL